MGAIVCPFTLLSVALNRYLYLLILWCVELIKNLTFSIRKCIVLIKYLRHVQWVQKHSLGLPAPSES